MQKSTREEPWWNRPWSKRQTLVAYFLVGWAGTIVITAFGDSQLNNRLPTLSEVGTYIFGGLVLAPLIAALGWLLSLRARRGLRGGGSADR
jgi:hypothetical protein